MKRTLFLLFSLMAGVVCFANDHIELVQNVPEDEQDIQPPRTGDLLFAEIDNNNVISILFSDNTESKIVVSDSANMTVFEQIYAASYSIQANLSALSSGSYTLHVYALGSWWYGYFEIE